MENTTLKIDYIPPTANERENIARTNKFLSAKVKKENTEKIMYMCLEQKIKKFSGDNIVYMDITFNISNFNRDEDNLLACFKYINDGLVKAGVVPNDTLKHLRFNKIKYNKVKKDNQSIEINFLENI